MAAAVGKYAARKMLGKEMKKYKNKDVGGEDDPYFEYVTLPNGKKKKLKRQIPDFIPSHDAEILASVKSTAYHLDWSLFNLFGIRFGWESVIGIIPAVGDVIGVLFALKIWYSCRKIDGGLPTGKSIQMLFWIFLDFVIGLAPFVGDLADGLLKCNTRNIKILESYLRRKYGPSDKKKRDTAGLEAFRGENDADTLAQLRAMGIQEDMESDEEGDGKNMAARNQPGGIAQGDSRWEQPGRSGQSPPRPPPKDQQQTGGRSWFSGGTRAKQPDPERGGHS